MKNIFALVDCNSFYVSCERVFRPDLKGKPVGILSNNDGCIVALSKELKNMGVHRGIPAFKIFHLVKQKKVTLFSSNYTLYGDMSARIMNVLSQFTPELEIYSIDEAFLNLNGFKSLDINEYGKKIKYTVEKWTGVPVSVGIGQTKTLAKIANHIAKKYQKFEGVFNIIDHPNFDKVLETVAVNNVWGIGHNYAKKLNKLGVQNVLQLVNRSDTWIDKNMTIVGLRTVKELRGISCIDLNLMTSDKKQIISSKSFGKPISDIDELKQSISTYCSRAVEKLREQNSVAQQIMIFILTNPFKDTPQYANYISGRLSVASAYTPDFINLAIKLLMSIYKENYLYKKSGVMISDISPQYDAELNLFETAYVDDNRKIIMDCVDSINHKWGRNIMTFGSEGIAGKWQMKREFLSQRFTTNWNELPIVKA